MQPLQHDDPRSIGTFRLQARIGAGGMATVYLGLSKGGRRAAVKVMHAEHASDPQARERLRREADAAAKAGDGYGAPFIEAAPEDETPWIATEFLPSVSVRDAVRRFGTMPAAQARSIAAGLAHALRSVHEAGIVHLDVKPGNVLLTDDGVRLVDFGTARELGDDGRTAAPAPAGTRGFMSPEQAEGARLGPAGDVYAFGATLAFACTGEPSTEDSSWPDDFADEGLRELAARCMAPDPSDRPTVPELIEQLAEADEPWTSDELEAAIAASAELPPAEPKASRRR
ncbi:serine/threonine-protein kinase, partial [Glycomyces tenuis]